MDTGNQGNFLKNKAQIRETNYRGRTDCRSTVGQLADSWKGGGGVGAQLAQNKSLMFRKKIIIEVKCQLCKIAPTSRL